MTSEDDVTLPPLDGQPVETELNEPRLVAETGVEARVAAIIKDMGAVAAVQLGHTGRKGSEMKPWEGGAQLAADHPCGWQVNGPSALPFGGKFTQPVHALSTDEIKRIHNEEGKN